MTSTGAVPFKNAGELAQIVESTLLDPKATHKSFKALLHEAHEYGFRCVVVPSVVLPALSRPAREVGVKLCSVIGFPSGLFSTSLKASEIEEVLSHEVISLDLVPNFTLLEREEELERELCELGSIVKDRAELKVIVEAPLMRDEELELLARISARCGASYLKTSTGVYSKGGDVESVRRTRVVADKYGLRVKAAGGIRALGDLLSAIGAGASLVGTSSARKIWEEYLNLKSRQYETV
ncbi:MAG: deoxyribose-phosphate aldolase [Acidilobaceae archaeon]|nr:deoxyribose-phosphate aldolase [Acidilobaceae archaeon]MDW7974670.1 deoxyribose-phosphate aldolase [Sulfolobales archaeon]